MWLMITLGRVDFRGSYWLHWLDRFNCRGLASEVVFKIPIHVRQRKPLIALRDRRPAPDRRRKCPAASDSGKGSGGDL
jgi:hypothetical protein